MKKTILYSILFFSYSIGNTQGFIASVSQLYPSKDCKVELTDGTLVEGAMASAVLMGGLIKTVKIKDANGLKVKYKAEEIKVLKIKAGSMAKLEMMSEGTSSITKSITTDFNEVIDREYIIYEQALLPSKKDKYRLLQLLNPGFDNRIKVYQDPDAKETAGLTAGSVKIGGGEDKSYLIVKDGAKSELLKKKSYKKMFPIIFGDCDLTEVLDDSKLKFKNFAAHVFIYDQICEKKED